MGKAQIQAQINSLRSAGNYLSAEIRSLEASKQALSAYSTKVEYVLKSHEHIKETYHLAGTPYLESTNQEEDILKVVKSSSDDKKDIVIGKLEAKIQALSNEQAIVSAEISRLVTIKSTMKED